MAKLSTWTDADLAARHGAVGEAYAAIGERNLQLDLTRGKPSADQLDLSNELDGILDGYLLQDGTDVRNYGGILGIPEARALGARLLDVAPGDVLAGGNSSLNLMYHFVNYRLDGGPEGDSGWRKSADDVVKFICPVPGYDRHFTVCDHFGIEMINVGFDDEGPDMDQVEALVRDDPAIKGMWCIPKYANPTGHTYSDATVARFARLAKMASLGFTIFWDNAYAVHTLTDAPAPLANLLQLANAEGTADNVVMFASTSKITFAGAGVAFLATSEANLAAFEAYLSASVIGFDKVNQLRHARFLPDDAAVAALMQQHRELIAPKFEMVEEKLASALGGKDIASWTHPDGGYFVSLDARPGLASEIVRLAAEVGVKLTPAGATFPRGHDPEDANIRIAPTFPPIEDLAAALDVLVVCIELATVQHEMSSRS